MNDDITRLADDVSDIAKRCRYQTAAELNEIVRRLRIIAQQQGKAGGAHQATPEMIAAGAKFAHDNELPAVKFYAGLYAAMREAAPQPPAHSPDAGVTALIDFAKWAIRNSAFEGCNLDGCDVQEKAAELGLLKEVRFSEPCSEEHCSCAEAGAEFPTTCYRFAAALAPQPKDAA